MPSHVYNAGVRFPGLIHPGLIGTAPSKELLDIWNAREASLVNGSVQPSTLCDILHQRPLANLPTPKSSLLGLVINIPLFMMQYYFIYVVYLLV